MSFLGGGSPGQVDIGLITVMKDFTVKLFIQSISDYHFPKSPSECPIVCMKFSFLSRRMSLLPLLSRISQVESKNC